MTTGPVIFIVPGNPIAKQSFRYAKWAAATSRSG